MIRHIVFFKIDNQKMKLELKDKLNELPNKIDFIEYLEVGENFTNSDRAFDLSLIVDFKIKEDLIKYATHKEHLPIVEYIKANNIVTKVVDYAI